jgi:hypothetical protein
MVFVETMGAINTQNASAQELAELACDHPDNQERRDYASIEHEVWDNRRKIGDFPLTVISNDYGKTASNEEKRTSVRAQRGWLALSPPGRQVVVTSGHHVPETEAELLVNEILRLFEQARTK